MSQDEPLGNEEISERLLELATRLDREPNLAAQSVSMADFGLAEEQLSEQDRLALQRIRDAVGFMRGLLPSDLSDGQALNETRQNAQLKTPADPSSEAGLPNIARDRLGRFQIEREIGAGGFARVYLAHDPQLNRQVALKLLRGTLFFSQDATLRFQREAEAAAVLSHPNIVPVYEAGVIDDQRYIASAFCEGVTLEAWLEKTAVLAPREAAALGAELADALEHAHQRGVIHRDLKPANVLLEPLDSRGETSHVVPFQPRIADFGLAKHVGRTDQLETAEGAIVGTPAYMSPEQAEGQVDVSHATDVYALGVMLYQMITGQLPILGTNNISTLLAVKTNQPKRPRQVNPKVPADLESIVMKCLSKAAVERYDSAHQLAEDLRRFLRNEPVVARSISPLEKTVRWVKRNPVLSAAFAGVSMAMVFALVQWRSATAEFDRAEQNLELANFHTQRAEKQVELSQSIIDQMVTQVAVDKKLPPSLRRSVAEKAARFQKKLYDDSDSDPAAAVKAMQAYNRLAILLFDLADFEDALVETERSLRIADTLPSNSDVANLRTTATQLKANILTLLDQGEKAIDTVKEVNRPATPPHQRSANQFSIGMAKLDMKKYEQAIDAFDEGLKMLEQSNSGHQVFQRAKTLLYRGRAEMNLERFEKANATTQEALTCYLSVLDTHPSNSRSMEDAARCYLQQSEIFLAQISEDADAQEKQTFTNRAIEPLRLARETFEKLIEENELVQRYWGQLGYCFFLQLKLELELEAIPKMEATIKSFDSWIQRVPEANVHRDDIREVLIQYRVQLAKLAKRLGESDSAVTHVELAKEQAELFLKEARKPEVFEPHLETLKTLRGRAPNN